MAVRIGAGEVQQVDAREDDEEAAEEGDCVYGRGCVEAAEEEEGGDESEGCEGYVVEGVDTGEVSIDSSINWTAEVRRTCLWKTG